MSSPASSDNAFKHEPLPDPAKYIRLLEVLDDNYSKTIKVRCRLTTWPIDSVPPYHAISYTWGDAGSNTTILMNDQPLRVRMNCEFALKQAYWYKRSYSYLYRKWRSRCYEQNRGQWYSKSRYIWLDAICIDQMNLGEKSKQVAMMGSIYKRASHVLACIGDHADDSLFFFQTLYGLSRHVVQPRDMIRYKRFGGAGVSFRFRLIHRYLTTHRFVLALARLATRPYFTRLWILQELQHAQHITILCGKYVLPKDDALYLFGGLLEDLKCLEPKENSFEVRLSPSHVGFVNHSFFRRHVNHGVPLPVWYGDWMYRLPRQCRATLFMLRQNYKTVKDNIFLLLQEVVSRLQCVDPRDQVYGIISLIDWGNVPPLEPDYTHSDLEVATKFIEAIMKLGEAQEIGEPMWKYVIITIRLLSLNIESRGMAEALEARRGAPEGCVEGTAAMPIGGPTVRVQQYGWRLSQEDIDMNTSKLQDLETTPLKDDVFFVPRWARANDWVIEVETRPAHDLWYDAWNGQYQMMPNYKPLLIVRQGTNGSCSALIGYGFYLSNINFRTPWFKEEDHVDIDIYFDTEDAIVLLVKMKQLYDLSPDRKDWMVSFLDTGVCRQQAPGSSYAVLPPNLPPKLPHAVRTKPSRPRSPARKRWFIGISRDSFHYLKSSNFVLFDTKARRGWLVNGEVVALQLLCAYLRNIPQTEPFDFSRLNKFGDYTPGAERDVLMDTDNKRIPIFRVLEDVGETAERGQSSKGEPDVDRNLIFQILEIFYDILVDMNPGKLFPGEGHSIFGAEITIARNRNLVVKGWDFERLYRNNRAKVYAHVFETKPVWYDFVKDLDVSFIFGSDLGEVIQPDRHCCPYFKALPEGQDFLAMAMHTLQGFVHHWSDGEVKSDVVGRLSGRYAWEHAPGVRPFSHMHGQGDHLEQVDFSCFPVQRLVRVPHVEGYKYPERELSLLKKRKPRLYSAQDVEDMNVGAEEDASGAACSNTMQSGERPPKAGMIVFGKRPDGKKLRKLAQASESQRCLSKSATGAHNSELRKLARHTERAGTGTSGTGMSATESS